MEKISSSQAKDVTVALPINRH